MKSRHELFSGTQFLLKIRSYEEDQMVGIIYDPDRNRSLMFENTNQMLFRIQELLNGDETAHADRNDVFEAASQETGYEMVAGAKPWLTEKKRFLANFSLEILFLERGGWQGILRHLGTKRQANFRNIMELLLMLHDELVHHSGSDIEWDETER